MDPNNGPGSTVSLKKFGDDLPNTTIGVKRNEKVVKTPGPGEYCHEIADRQVKDRKPGYEWHKSSGRKEQ